MKLLVIPWLYSGQTGEKTFGMDPFFVNTPQVPTKLGKWIFLEGFEAALPKMRILKILSSKIFISLEIMPYA